MKSRPIRSLTSADRDFDAIVNHYVREASFDVAERFVHALDAAYVVIGDTPGAGSPLLSGVLDLPDFRTWNLRGFPYLICYQQTSDAVVVWRILHAQRDLVGALAETASRN